MEQKPLPSGPDVGRLQVPEELLQQLREANARFHTAKERLGEAMDEAEYSHGAHVEGKYAELRKAELDMEEISKKIGEILRRGV